MKGTFYAFPFMYMYVKVMFISNMAKNSDVVNICKGNPCQQNLRFRPSWDLSFKHVLLLSSQADVVSWQISWSTSSTLLLSAYMKYNATYSYMLTSGKHIILVTDVNFSFVFRSFYLCFHSRKWRCTLLRSFLSCNGGAETPRYGRQGKADQSEQTELLQEGA